MARDLKLQVVLAAIDKATKPIRGIMKSSGQLAEQFKAGKEQLKGLNQQQRDVAAYRRANIEIVKQTRAMRDLAAKTSGQTAELEKQQSAHQNIKASLKAAKTQYNKLSKALIEGKGTTAEFHRELEKAQIKLLSSEQAFTRSANTIKKYKDRIRSAGTQMDSLTRQNAASRDQLNSLKIKLDSAGIGTDGLATKARKLKDEQKKLNTVLDDQREKLRKLSIQQERMAKARNALGRSQRLAGGMAASGAAGVGTAYAVSRPLAGIVNAFAPAEDAATQLKVAMMGSDGSVPADFQKITELATRLGDRLPGTTADFQEMMTMLRRQGISAQAILGGTGEAAAYLGVQLQMPATEAAEFAAKMQDATRTVETDMLDLMDTIQRAFYIGVDSNNMLQGFSKMSPVMGILKKEGVAAANALAPLLVMMDQTGMAGESSGNAIRKVFQAGVTEKRFTDANDALTEMKAGFQLDFTDGNGEFGGIENMFAQIKKLEALGTVQRTTVMKYLFGDDSETLQVVNTMMTKGIAGYREVEAKMQAQADLRKRVNEQLQTLTNEIDAAQGSWTNAMAEFGAAVAPELKDLIRWLGEMANSVGAWARENPKLAATIVKVVAGFALFVGVLGALGIVLASIIGPIALVRFALLGIGIRLPSIVAMVGKLASGFTAMGGVSGVLLKLRAGFSMAGGAVGFLRAAFGGLFRLMTIFIRTNPLAALVIGVGAAVMHLVGRFDEIKKLFNAGDWMGLGKEIINGIIAGLNAATLGLFGVVVDIAKGAVSKFADVLGIRSPSRVFADLGEDTMAGLQVGLQRSQSGPMGTITKAGKAMAGAGALALGIGASGPAIAVDSRPPLQGGSLAPIVVQGDTITIQITAGGDTAQIEQMLNRLLNERERNKAARIRSSIHDQD